MNIHEEKLKEELNSLKRVTNGIHAAVIIQKDKDNNIVGKIEPVFKQAIEIIARDMGTLQNFVRDLSMGNFGDTYDLLFRYQSIMVSLRTIDIGYLVLLINSKAELPTIRSFSTLTVRNLNNILEEEQNV